MDISRPKVLFGFKDNKIGLKGKELIKRDISMQIALSLLAGKSSDFFNRLYNAQIIDNSFYFGYNISPDYGAGYFAAETEKYEELISELKNEIVRFKERDIDTKEFERIKKGLIGSIIRMFNGIENLVITNTRLSFDEVNVFDYYEVLNSISAEDVKQAFSTAFDDKYCSTALILPQAAK